jgi:hypothetical protein
VNARVVGVIAAVAVALIGASYFLFFVRPERAVEPAPPLAPETLRLAAASGVEIAGSDGVWRAAHPGERLSAHDRIRTDDEGAAELLTADGSSVRLSAATEARVDELRRELKRLSLGTGELSADVRDDPARVFEVALDDKGAVARTRGAAFTANSDGKGGAAVATRRGEVILSARGKEVVIRSGQFARLARGAPPEDPTPIPQSLFLKVTWPPTSTNRKSVTVKGVTDPNARIKVAGHYIPVEADGRYIADVPLSDGTHRLDVRASDVAGHVVDEKSPKILVDTTTDFKVHPPKWR